MLRATILLLLILASAVQSFRTCAGEPFPGWTGHMCVVCKCDMTPAAADQPRSERCVWTLIEHLHFWDYECRREIHRQFDIRRSFSPFNMALHNL